MLHVFRNWFAGIRCPAFDQQRRCSFRAVAGHDGRCPRETASPPITIDVHSDVSRALSLESHRHPHGLHPYVQHRSEHTLRHTVVMAFELRGLVRKLGRSPTSLSGNRSLAYSAATRAGWFPQESIGLGQKPGAAGRNDSAACDIRGSSAETATISR
jgi:hypothetical protein